jgi:hypothetical protein
LLMWSFRGHGKFPFDQECYSPKPTPGSGFSIVNNQDSFWKK